GLTAEERAKWDALFAQAVEHYRSDVPAAIALLRQAHAIDDRYAASHFELGKCYESVGQFAEAREEYVRARDEDVCPLRMITPLEEALFRVADETGTPLIDAHELLEAESRNGILGETLLVDHVHPSFHGHQRIADALAAEMRRQGWFQPRTNWQTERDRVFAAHFAALDDMYYFRGQRQLDNLEAWTKGQADGPPIEDHSSAEVRQRVDSFGRNGKP
ncbi:MAG: tetratricopeptide repeat protein, partial [Planctomycetaceae bacterium]